VVWSDLHDINERIAWESKKSQFRPKNKIKRKKEMVKKRIYTAPAAVIVRVITDEGIAAASNTLSSSVKGKSANWETDEVLGDATTEDGNACTYWH
jgi:hypothetical protein